MKIALNTHRVFWVLQILGWSVYWLFITVFAGDHYGFTWYLLLWNFVIALIGGGITLLIRTFYKSITIRYNSLGRILLLVGATTFVGVNLWYPLDIILDHIMKKPPFQTYPIAVGTYLYMTFYWAILLLTWNTFYFVIKFWLEWSQQRNRTKQSTLLAQQAQLQMLRYQVNPHFLFNSLNSIRALIDENETQAREMVTELSEFLRYSLVHRTQTEVPLSKEIQAIQYYLRVEKKRFEHAIDVQFDIDPLAEDYPIQNFLLHPLIENAVKHGMQTSELPLRITLYADMEGDTLYLRVCNSGKWIERNGSPSSNGTGTGLANIRKRLENAYPHRHQFKITSDDSMVCIHIRITHQSEIKSIVTHQRSEAV